MIKLGLIREEKIPHDERVALTPAQCKWLQKNFKDIRVKVQHSSTRCFSDKEYQTAGIDVAEEVSDCDVLFGIKEVPKELLVPGKKYFFFSHTKKLQPHNQAMLQEIVKKKITLTDYECLEHDDGTRILGFGFFAGIVGAHNGMMCYGNRTGEFQLPRVYAQKSFRQLIHCYFGLKLPNVKIAVTGSGRVAQGALEIMNLMGIRELEPDEFLEREFAYPVYVHLRGSDLYEHKKTGKYNRNEFHTNPVAFSCKFNRYLGDTDILMNGVYWQQGIPRLFEMEDIPKPDFRLKTIADITDDFNGSVPCNIGDGTIDDPVYGVDRNTFQKTPPYQPNSVDVMAVGNLPNELPRDASRYFGEQLIKYVLEDVRQGGSKVLERATIVKNGSLNNGYEYMKAYAEPVTGTDNNLSTDLQTPPNNSHLPS